MSDEWLCFGTQWRHKYTCCPQWWGTIIFLSRSPLIEVYFSSLTIINTVPWHTLINDKSIVFKLSISRDIPLNINGNHVNWIWCWFFAFIDYIIVCRECCVYSKFSYFLSRCFFRIRSTFRHCWHFPLTKTINYYVNTY